MAVVSDVFELTMESTYLGQVCYNVFFYAVSAQVNVVTLPGLRLANAFNILFIEDEDAFLRSLNVSNDVRYTAIRTRNLFNVAEIGELLTGVHTGANAGDSMPSHDAYGLRTSRTTGAIRRGMKRFPGVPENGVVGNDLTAPVMTALLAFGEALTTELTYVDLDSEITFSPVVVKRVREGVEPDWTYRLPENAGEAVFDQIVEWQPYNTIRTQNSRKPGRGI